MKKFEYKIIYGSVDFNPAEDEIILTKAGKKGWEFVFYIEAKAKNEGLGAKKLYYFMKREILNNKHINKQ